MEIRSIHLGGLFHAEEEIQMTSTMANFVGHMQGFVYNGHRYNFNQSNGYKQRKDYKKKWKNKKQNLGEKIVIFFLKSNYNTMPYLLSF